VDIGGFAAEAVTAIRLRLHETNPKRNGFFGMVYLLLEKSIGGPYHVNIFYSPVEI
jgi:hypothetical protein